MVEAMFICEHVRKRGGVFIGVYAKLAFIQLFASCLCSNMFVILFP